MTMSLKEFSALKGCMKMVTSANDNEALQAIRAANRLLAKHNLTWEQVFARTVTVIEAAEPAPADDEELEVAFRTALDSVHPGSFRNVLLDLQARYVNGQHLSEKQRAVVTDAAARAVDRMPAGRVR